MMTRRLLFHLWLLSILLVVIGSLLPAASPVMRAVGMLPVSAKVLHFCAYLAISSLPVIAFRDRRRGILTGLSMFALGILLEGAQHFSPGRSVEFGDVIVNGAGVSCGVLLAFPLRTFFALI
jgi:VanZ family protein